METKSGNALKGGNVAGGDDEDDENDLNPSIDAHWLQREQLLQGRKSVSETQ